MIVAGGKLVWGTVGGGRLEQLALEHAGLLLERSGRQAETIEVPLSEKAGQCCGGAVTLFVETFPWTRTRVAVFGAGHVGQALGGLAPYLDADLVLIDPRDEAQLQPALPAERPYETLFVDAPEEEVDHLPAESLLVVMTHSHALDLEILARALNRGTFPFVGLIGSERKWERFRRRLESRGFDPEALARVRCPIGLGRTSKEPRAIALAVAAELQEVIATRESSRSTSPPVG